MREFYVIRQFFAKHPRLDNVFLFVDACATEALAVSRVRNLSSIKEYSEDKFVIYRVPMDPVSIFENGKFSGK